RRGESSFGDSPRVNIVAIATMIASIAIGGVVAASVGNPIPVVIAALVGFVLMQSPKIAQQWEKGVVLRLGKFVGLRGPGLFWVVPLIDTVSLWIDQRVITTSFAAEQTLTRDTVPVNVDAVLFWMVYDPEKAALEVQEYRDALQDAMSREAQAAREKQARIILGEAEVEIAKLFKEASVSYQQNPTALHLRAMKNMLYEGLKEKGALMLVPSTAVESMGLGGL